MARSINRREKILLTILVVVTSVSLALYVKNGNLKTGGLITIVGDERCRAETQTALQYLKEKAPSYYAMVEKYIGRIECVEAGSGINVYERPPRFQAGRATREAGVEWYAGSIVHDACHVFLYTDYVKKHPLTTPPQDVWSGETAEMKCIEIQTNALKDAGAPTWTFTALEDARRSRYWEAERWW